MEKSFKKGYRESFLLITSLVYKFVCRKPDRITNKRCSNFARDYMRLVSIFLPKSFHPWYLSPSGEHYIVRKITHYLLLYWKPRRLNWIWPRIYGYQTLRIINLPEYKKCGKRPKVKTSTLLRQSPPGATHFYMIYRYVRVVLLLFFRKLPLTISASVVRNSDQNRPLGSKILKKSTCF